ncbi:MAG: DUF4430 domain-containing protein [Solirubrobacterales bacterium]
MKWATVAITLMAAVAVLPGCGLGAGSQDGKVELLVTTDYGSRVLVEKEIGDLTESETAMRVLDGSTDIETRYSGGFVQSVNGISGGNQGGRSRDWFYSVNGIVSERGSAEFEVGAGDLVWWDNRDWTDAMEIGAVVGAYPAPLATGYDGTVWPVVIQCVTDPQSGCDLVKEQLASAGIDATMETGAGSSSDDTLRILVGNWADMAADSDAGRLAKDPSASGVFAKFVNEGSKDHLLGLAQDLGDSRDFGPEAGLVAAVRNNDGPPVWIVTGGSPAGALAAASILTAADLQHRYAAVVSDGLVSSLPLP